jgi:hypothetical protein
MLNIDAIVRPVCVAVVATVVAWPEVSHAQPSVTADLHRVKRVHLEKVRDATESQLEVEKRLHAAATEALVSHGFLIVDKPHDADGTIKVDMSWWITVDGPQPDPPAYTFVSELTSSSLNVKWQTKFDVHTRAEEREVIRTAMRRVARNLFNAWKDSARKAGVKVVDDRVP